MFPGQKKNAYNCVGKKERDFKILTGNNRRFSVSLHLHTMESSLTPIFRISSVLTCERAPFSSHLQQPTFRLYPGTDHSFMLLSVQSLIPHNCQLSKGHVLPFSTKNSGMTDTFGLILSMTGSPSRLLPSSAVTPCLSVFLSTT